MVWEPGAIGWWIADLFMVGSACFAAASAPGVSSAVSPAVVGGVFFLGSAFFTAAAYLQYVQSINNSISADSSVGPPRRVRLLAWQPALLGWWITIVQLVGTVFFNLNTAHALQQGLSVKQADLRVWTPDFLGSICFLLASWLAVMEIRDGRRLGWGDVSWRIVMINLAGSVLFMASAIAAFVRPATGDLAAATVANTGTFLGALCFLWGARLLLDELAQSGGATT